MNTLQTLIPYLILLSHILFVILFVLFLARRSFGGKTIRFMRKHVVTLGFLITLVSLLGSLFYSNVVGFAPCVLCWWQRICLYPQVVIFAAALHKQKLSSYVYSLPLSIIGAIIAAYHVASNAFGSSLLPCTAVGGECSRVYVHELGYITIPVMALTAFLYLILLAFISRTHEA